jgi:ABC-type transporter Mla subunit MlaD
MSGESRWSGATSDTGNLLDGTALGAPLGDNGAAGGFSIDYERLPQAIADLEAAADFLDDRAKTALHLAHVRPPGTDGISVNAAAQIGKWAADGGVNNLHATLVAGAKQTRDLAQKLREDLKTYLKVEELNIPTTASPGLPQPSPGRPL